MTAIQRSNDTSTTPARHCGRLQWTQPLSGLTTVAFGAVLVLAASAQSASAQTTSALPDGAQTTSAATADAVTVNRVVLRVGDRIATLFDYQNRLGAVRNSILQQGPEDETERRQLLEEAPDQVFKTLWDEMLIVSRADQLGLVMSEGEVDDMIRQTMEQLGITDQQQLRAALRQEGLTYERYRESLRNNNLFRQVVGREVVPRIEVSDEDLRRLYRDRLDELRIPEQRLVRELVVLDREDLSSTEQQQLAERLRSDWLGGGDPQTLSEVEGAEVVAFVDIGWVSAGDLAEDLEATVWAAPVGEVLEPSPARGGLHIIQVSEIKEASVRPFEEVRDALLQFERSQRLEDEQQEYLRELEDRAWWEMDPPEEVRDFRTAAGKSLFDGGMRLLQAAGSAGEDPGP